MVKDWCGASCVWSKLYMDKLYCMDGWMGIYLQIYIFMYICMVDPQVCLLCKVSVDVKLCKDKLYVSKLYENKLYINYQNKDLFCYVCYIKSRGIYGDI